MTCDCTDAMPLLERMFEVELGFLRSEEKDVESLARAFHPDVVVHEPASLPYAGDWKGLEGIAALLGRMSEVWSDMAVADMTAARVEDTVFMACTLKLTSRATGAVIEQPFAEVLHFRNGLLLDGTPFYYDTAGIVAVV
ncbi:nuclear transport factor 2 family protein [Mesorhizobium sp. 1M-11]|uniref:nuclear transport factor 2 family protein n=1 Tax=Mesorhizobium sp. 1M-11 TaxID=1529006 RepID=UPI000A7CE04C|nr:nuclear transport factor 2 family protein [Mesorhizobium sp. 1M-11]